MRNGCFVLIIFFFLLYLIMDTDIRETESDLKVITIPNPKPDPNRVVYEFDWDRMVYVYADEVKPDSGRYHDPGIMPDYYVQTLNEKYTPNHYRDNQQVLVKGKRFRVREQPGGVLQLIPIR